MATTANTSTGGLGEVYLEHGLNTLSRAHAGSYFADGHRGGAVLSACFFGREEDVEPGVPVAIAALVDEHLLDADLCAPFADTPAMTPDPTSLLRRLTDVLAARGSVLREAGHNVILPALAVKACVRAPRLLTADRVDGLCRLVEAFRETEVPQDEGPLDLPDPTDAAAFCRFAAREFVACAQRFEGRGQGWTGHLMTFARALLDLCEAGQPDTARAALAGFKIYLRRARFGPRDTDKPRPEHAPLTHRPLQAGYWTGKGDWNLGHALKYPYGYYGILRHVDDADLHAACEDVAFRIL